MNIGKAIKRNLVEGALVFAGILILIVQFAVAKHELSNGGTDYTSIIGAPLDDVYIHARYAERLSWHEYAFNNGVVATDNPSANIVSADTSPLWVAMIAIGRIFTSHLDLVAIILSAIAWLLLAPRVYRIARYVFGWEQSFSIAAAICMLLSPRLLAMNLSGMETTFATLLVLVAVEMHIRSREMKEIRIREAIVLGLGVAVRPEFYLLILIVSVDWLFVLINKKIPLRKFIAYWIPIVISIFLVTLIPFSEPSLFPWYMRLVYHSSFVQGTRPRLIPDFYYIGRSFYILLENFWWIIFLSLFSLRSFRSLWVKGMSPVVIIFITALPIAQGFVAPQYRHFGRYIFPLIPLVVLVLVGLFRQNALGKNGIALFRNMKESKRAITLSGIVIFCSLPISIKWIGVYADAVRNINDQHLAAAAWMKDNVRPDDKVAADDVGALGYFTKRDILDLTGLVSPEFFWRRNNQSLVWNEARLQGSKYFIIYTKLNPPFYRYAKDSLELVKEFPVRLPLVSSADTVMSVFKVKGS